MSKPGRLRAGASRARRQDPQDRYVIDHLARDLTPPRRQAEAGEASRPPGSVRRRRRFGGWRGRVLQDALRKARNGAGGGLPEF